MEKVPREIRPLIQEFASDRIGVHPTAQLMHTLRMFDLCERQCFKMVMCDFESDEFFNVMRDGQLVRVCDLIFHYKEEGGVYRPVDGCGGPA